MVVEKTFSNESLSRCDQFYQIFVQIGANLAVFQPFEISIFFRNFEGLFTPRNQLRSASNFAKTRFTQSPTFHVSTPPKKSAKFSDRTKHFGSKKKSRIENQCFINLARFSWNYGQTDVKIRFCVKFCSRYSFPEVCMTKNHAKMLSRGGKSGNFFGAGRNPRETPI